MKRRLLIPPERQRQFDVIAAASALTLKWAHQNCVSLETIEPVVPFVETDFSLSAWLFVDTEARLGTYRSDGTAGRLIDQFLSDLTDAGYPAEWISLVTCYFGSKEIVDRDHEGSYFFFLR